MAKKTAKGHRISARDIFPLSDEKVIELIPDFAWAIARAAAATVLADRVLTVAEYEAVADSATCLESISSYPGLMSYLVLTALEESPELNKALKDLQRATKKLPAETRQAVFDATIGVRLAQGDDAPAMHARWAKALQAHDGSDDQHGKSDDQKASRDFVEAGRAQIMNTWRRLADLTANNQTGVIERAKAMAETFQDKELQAAIETCESSSDPEREPRLQAAAEAAADRALRAATAKLKGARDLDQQQELANRFLKTTDALVDQVQSRISSVERRLQLQEELFNEDLDSFIENSLDSLELSMAHLMKGRYDWASADFWEEFKQQTAYAELQARLAPLRDRYVRIFDLWRHELEAFSRESATIRSSVLSSVDMRAFSALVPTQRSTASLKCALDRVSDTTLGLSLLGVLAVGAAAAAGVVQAAVVVAAVANPVGATIGAAVGAAALWNVVSNREARKEKLVKDKRAKIRAALEHLLQGEGLAHNEMANDVLRRFVTVAVEQYTPMIVEARLWAMKARLERAITKRVLNDTRSFLTNAAR